MLQRAPQTNWLDCCRSSRVVLCGDWNVGQARWRKPEKFRQAFLRRKSSHAVVQTRENLKCAFIGGLKFEIKSFDQPSCRRCNEHNKHVDFMLDWCSCHSGGDLCSDSNVERARRRKPQNVSGQTCSSSSAALSQAGHRRKLSCARCCTNPRKLVPSLRTRSLFRFHFGVRLGRKPLWENVVFFLQCSW